MNTGYLTDYLKAKQLAEIIESAHKFSVYVKTIHPHGKRPYVVVEIAKIIGKLTYGDILQRNFNDVSYYAIQDNDNPLLWYETEKPKKYSLSEFYQWVNSL